MSITVGTLTVEPRADHHKTFEYAGCGETWQLEGAEVEITYVNFHWFVGKRPGTRTESWFNNRIGACTSMSRDNDHKAGTIGVQMDSFGMGQAVLDGRMVLNEEWELFYTGSHYSLPYDRERDANLRLGDRPLDMDRPIVRVRRKDPDKRYEGV